MLAGRGPQQAPESPEEYQGGTVRPSPISANVRHQGHFRPSSIPPPHHILAARGGRAARVVKTAASAIATIIVGEALGPNHRAVYGALGSELMVALKRYNTRTRGQCWSNTNPSHLAGGWSHLLEKLPGGKPSICYGDSLNLGGS